MSNASDCRKPELRECENCAEANWQYASFDEVKKQLVQDFFHNQRNPDAEFSEGIKPKDIKAGASGSSGESSPATTHTSPEPAEQRGRSAVKGSEYGRRAVFIVLSGGHSKPAVPLTPEAEGALLVRVKEVKGLLNVWKPVEVHTSTLGKKVRRRIVLIKTRLHISQVRLDAIFGSSRQARGAFKAIHDNMRSRTAPSLAACCMVDEEDLGYTLPPILTEGQLLMLLSAKLCRNVFLTSLPIRVDVDGEGEIRYCFNSVTDVNLFLFRTHASKDMRAKGKGLGYLVRNDIKSNIILEEKGDNTFELMTEHKNLPEEVFQFPGICVTPIQAGAAIVGNLLNFTNKLSLYKFLVSSEASRLDHLQFCEQMSVPTEIVDVGSGSPLLKQTHAHQRAKPQVSIGACNLRLREKEEEIGALRRQLEEVKGAMLVLQTKLELEVKGREIAEKQLEEIHELSMS